MRKWLIQFLVSRAGAALSTAVTALAAIMLSKLAELSPDIAAMIDQTQLAAILWAIAMSAINYATNHWLTKDARAIQEALVKKGSELDVDGWIGDDTVRELQQQTGLPVKRAFPVDPSLIKK